MINYDGYDVLEDIDVTQLLEPRDSMAHKGTFGYVALVGGSLSYSGAIRLAAMSNCAMRAGAGVVKVALPRSLAFLILPDVLDATVFPLSDADGMIEFDEMEFSVLIRGVSVIAFGMGIGRSREVQKALTYLLKNYDGTLIIDADGLNELSGLDGDLITNSDANIIITPHPKEFSRLTGKTVDEILADPMAAASAYARKHKCTVLLKGAESVITDGRRTIINKRGCAGMATAGSGDVLSGIMAAIFGWGHADNVTLAAMAAYIAGCAGELAQEKSCDISMTASDTAKSVSEAIARLQGRRLSDLGQKE